ncbi:hypothetical protein HNP46_000325 [Pseudomonas nitritireducens]|uniref:Uncharacterized protein n=1 Tax=Pseudomonas nitroreducens TaxID=46680 RepID=A0A7W7NZE4_PSENT|nr:hypothetical protein [Pseudomonas nitritireducens]MBB4861514.1 hypothetical protein [Pseudomonas nitritireducens]
MLPDGVKIQQLPAWGHPFTRDDGWDALDIIGSNQEGIEQVIRAAEKKFWRHWMTLKPIGSSQHIRMYKPTGAHAPWADEYAELGVDSKAYAERTRHRIEEIGIVWVICSECGGKLYEDDARPGEKTDRAGRCRPNCENPE